MDTVIPLKPGTDLAGALSTPDARRLAEKANPFIKKETVYGPDCLVPVPQEAKVFRTKGGELLFFTHQHGPNNHVVEIPERVRHIQYPQYRAHDNHIYYGEPVFHY